MRITSKGQVTIPAEIREQAGLLVLPDARLPSVRQRIALEVGQLNRAHEDEALSWIEAVSEFDDLDGPKTQ
jgi:hypothetical protein